MSRILLTLALLSIFSCDQKFTPDIVVAPPEIVVEGYIEGGQRPLPPYVILTRSFPFFSKLGTSTLNELFVHDATIRVSTEFRTIELAEFCLSELSDAQKAIVSELTGIDITSLAIDICIYTDPNLEMLGEIGKTYTLEVEADGHFLSATTTIPRHVWLDSLKFTEPFDVPNDTLAELRAFVSDPADEANFYRYFTRVNDGPYETPIASVIDDRLFNGLSFEFPMPKAETSEEGLSIATYGLFEVGDTATIRWINLDEPHYEFWSTLEFNAANQGPFSSYTRIKSNIEGGLGVWGGLSASYYELVVEK